MPVYSMTGYANAQSAPAPEGEEGPASARLAVEIRSVNSRFLDLVLRLPEDWRAAEPAVRERLTRRLKRGKVELRVAQESADAQVAEPSTRLLQRLVAVQDRTRAWLPQAASLSVAEVLRLAGAEGVQAAPGGSTDGAVARLLPVVDAAVEALLAAREREGARLVAIVAERVASLRTLAAQATPIVPGLAEQQRQRFLERWREAMSATGAAPSATMEERAMAEATAFALRIDVAEEVARLGSHLDEIDRLLACGGEVGKRLDFLIQELHREANTLGSKSAALELTRIAVDMKVAIEQMREQVQNIE